jgi:hypothetical protein
MRDHSGDDTTEAVGNWLPCRLVAEKLGLQQQLLYRACRGRKLSHRRLGGRLWINLHEARRVLIRDFPAVEGSADAQ